MSLSSTTGSAPGQRILAVDPGLTRCGFAVVDMAANRTGTFVHVQVSGTKAHEALENRVLAIMETAEALMDKFSPDVVAVERVFAQNNAPTVVGTAQATGVVIAAAARRKIPVAWHTPSEVKAAVTGDAPRTRNRSTAWWFASCGWRHRLGPPTPPTPLRWPCATAGAEAWPV